MRENSDFVCIKVTKIDSMYWRNILKQGCRGRLCSECSAPAAVNFPRAYSPDPLGDIIPRDLTCPHVSEFSRYHITNFLEFNGHTTLDSFLRLPQMKCQSNNKLDAYKGLEESRRVSHHIDSNTKHHAGRTQTTKMHSILSHFSAEPPPPPRQHRSEPGRWSPRPRPRVWRCRHQLRPPLLCRLSWSRRSLLSRRPPQLSGQPSRVSRRLQRPPQLCGHQPRVTRKSPLISRVSGSRRNHQFWPILLCPCCHPLRPCGHSRILWLRVQP